MVQITMTHSEFSKMIKEAVESAIHRNPPSPTSDELLTDEQAAEYLKCSSVFLWQQRKAGNLKFVKAGKKLLYPRSSLNSFIGLEKEVLNEL